MTDEKSARQALLERIGLTAVRHNSNEDLVPHLRGTRDLLESWGARTELCDAGLFHSAYGTEYFDDDALSDGYRQEVRAVLGPEAERLVWLWCTGRRNTLPAEADTEPRIQDRRTGKWIPLEDRERRDFVDLWIADTLEQLPRVPEREVPLLPVLHEYRHWAMPAAVAALEEALRRHPHSD